MTPATFIIIGVALTVSCLAFLAWQARCIAKEADLLAHKIRKANSANRASIASIKGILTRHD